LLGIARYIVSPGVIEVIIQKHGWKQAELERGARSEPLDDLSRTLIFFVRVGSGEVEVELIGLRLGQEFTTTSEGFQIEELIFDQAMHGFHIALEGVRRGRDAQMLAIAQSGGETGAMTVRIVAADEFAAVGTVVTKARAVGLIPCSRANCTNRKRWL
jgi:hypothetical protein